MSTATPTKAELLTPELLAQLERLELVTRKVFRGRMKGERRSKRKGTSSRTSESSSARDPTSLCAFTPGGDRNQLFAGATCCLAFSTSACASSVSLYAT